MWFKISLKNLALHWKHSLGAIISIASGFISLCIFQGYMNDVGRLYVDTFSQTKMFGDIIIEHTLLSSKEGKKNPLNYGLTLDAQVKIENYLNAQSDDVDLFMKFLSISGMLSNGDEYTIFEGRGHELDKGALMRTRNWAWDTMYGKPLYLADGPDSLVLGFSLAKLMGCKGVKEESFYDPIGGYIAENRPFTCKKNLLQLMVTTVNDQVNALDLDVSGFIDANYKEVDNKFVEVSLKNAQILMDTDKVSYFTLRLKDNVDRKKFIEKFNNFSRGNNLDIKAIPWILHDVGEMYVRTMQLLTIFRNFIVVVILFIAGLSIFNTMNKIIRERTREIGTLRSIGISQKIVTKIFMYESFLLGFFGVLIGMIISIFSTLVINAIGVTYKAGVLTQPVLFRIESSFTLYLISGLFLLFLNLLTSYFAIKQTTNKNIVESLTHS